MQARALGVGDAGAACAVIHAAFAAQDQVTDPPSAALRETPARIGARLRAGGGAGVWEGDVLMAVALWEARSRGLYVGRVAVLPGFRGRGLARALVEAADVEARRLGLGRLLVSVRVALAGNLAVFGGLGFLEVGRSSHPGYEVATSVEMERDVG